LSNKIAKDGVVDLQYNQRVAVLARYVEVAPAAHYVVGIIGRSGEFVS
jgi:hypothetical protein